MSMIIGKPSSENLVSRLHKTCVGEVFNGVKNLSSISNYFFPRFYDSGKSRLVTVVREKKDVFISSGDDWTKVYVYDQNLIGMGKGDLEVAISCGIENPSDFDIFDVEKEYYLNDQGLHLSTELSTCFGILFSPIEQNPYRIMKSVRSYLDYVDVYDRINRFFNGFKF